MTADRSGWSVRGRPSQAELAAVVAVLSAAGTASSGDAAPLEDRGGWSAYWRGLRDPVAAGPGAWRASGWPR